MFTLKKYCGIKRHTWKYMGWKKNHFQYNIPIYICNIIVRWISLDSPSLAYTHSASVNTFSLGYYCCYFSFDSLPVPRATVIFSVWLRHDMRRNESHPAAAVHRRRRRSEGQYRPRRDETISSSTPLYIQLCTRSYCWEINHVRQNCVCLVSPRLPIPLPYSPRKRP